MSSDPWEGNNDLPPSLNKYLYAYGNPTVYTDPDGRTSQQYQTLMTSAVESFRSSSNRVALGTAGELKLEKILQANGEVIIKGPATSAGAHNADVISYDPETKQVSFFDNKIQTKKASVSRANNLSSDLGRARSIDEAKRKLSSLDLDPKIRREISKALNAVSKNPSKAVWAVANASPAELAEVENKVKRVSKRLVDKGVKFADIVGDKVNILSASQSASNGKKVATKLGKAIPIAGTALSLSLASARLHAASLEDQAFRQSMADLGVGSTVFDSHSVLRETAIIAGEEAGGEGGALGGAAAVTPFSAGCGMAAPICIGLGAIAGGVSGDTIGGMGAEYGFDSTADEMLSGELERIKLKIRNPAQKIYVVEEDDDSPGAK